MKPYHYIAIGALLLIAAWFSRRPIRLAGARSQPLRPNYLMTVDESAEMDLECDYRTGSNVDRTLDVIDVVNRRMRLLQKNRSSWKAITANAANNRWHPYAALYNEALRQLLSEGLIVHNSADACAPPDANSKEKS